MKLKIAGWQKLALLALTAFLSVSAIAQQIGQRIWTPPPFGNFYSMANTNWPPLPWMPFDPLEIPLYYLGTLDGFTGYAYDDSGIVYPGQGGQSRNSNTSGLNDPPDPPGGGGEGEDPGVPEPGPVDYGTNLFIMIGPTNNNQAWLSLSNTHSGTYYQILSRTPLNVSGWDLGEIRQASGTLTPFSKVRTDDPRTRFFKGVGGDTIASIVLDPDYNLAVESATNGGPGQIGKFKVILSPAPASSRTVVYTITGTATNGVDYSDLTGTVSVSTSGSAEIVVQPNFDANVEFYETVTLSLVLTNGYVVDPTRQTAALQIYDPRPQEMAVAILDSGWTKLWWTNTAWAYFTLPEAVKEALRSDGTPFAVFTDLDIKNGALMTTNGLPKYPILISLGNETIRDDEIAPLTNYLAAGGFIFAGSSAFTRNTNGSPRGDFALTGPMGLSCAAPNGYWYDNTYLAKFQDHRLVDHIPGGTLVWRMPSSPEEVNWGTCETHEISVCASNRGFDNTHQIWVVTNSSAQKLAVEDGNFPYITVNQYGGGQFIYDAALQPLIGHGGFAPAMYSYLIFRRAIEWAFESAQHPIVKLSPWAYQYDAAFMVRHDLEDYADEISDVASSASIEHANGAYGDYYFCTGRITNEANYAAIVTGLQTAVGYGATIGPHNGGLPNPRANNASACCAMNNGTYEYWHWGPDEAMGLPGGKDYASNSLAIAFSQIETWLTNYQTNSPRTWVAPYFNATKEDSYEIQEGLGVKITGDQKLTPFPARTISTRRDGKLYDLLSEPTSDWFISGWLAQSLDPWHEGVHTTNSMREGVSYYYTNGFLINFYAHGLATGLRSNTASYLIPDYIQYSMNHDRFPRLWSTNARGVYQWWLKRSAAQVSGSFGTTNGHSLATITIKGAQDADTSIEILAQGTGTAAIAGLRTNGVLATGTNVYRVNHELVKVRVGTSVTNIQIEYYPGPVAREDVYYMVQGQTLTVSTNGGVLTNDFAGNWPGLFATNTSAPGQGAFSFSNDGGFSYTPTNSFWGTECFTYEARDAGQNSFGTAAVTIFVRKTSALFSDDLVRCSAGEPYPWQVLSPIWSIGAGVIQATIGQAYGNCYLPSLWTNSSYSVEAQVQISTGACGGGIGARLNHTTGAHYAAWLYPDTSSCTNGVLRLVKFSEWNHWGYNGTNNFLPVFQTNVAVGSGWHPLKLMCSNNVLQVFYHGTNVITATDADSALPAYTSGPVTLDIYNGSIEVGNLIVEPIP